MEARDAYLYMVHREVGLILQDVELIFGLPINGLPFIGIVATEVRYICERLVGPRPEEEHLKGQRVSMTWFDGLIQR